MGKDKEMKRLTTYIKEGFKVSSDTYMGIIAEDFDDLKRIAEQRYKDNNKKIDMSNVDVSKVDRLDCLFANMYDVEEIDLTDWDTRQVTTLERMFCNCYALKKIKFIEHINVGRVITAKSMFGNCNELEELDLKYWVFPNRAVDGHGMFNNCTSLRKLNLPNWPFQDLNAYNMFYNCNKSVIPGWYDIKRNNKK